MNFISNFLKLTDLRNGPLVSYTLTKYITSYIPWSEMLMQKNFFCRKMKKNTFINVAYKKNLYDHKSYFDAILLCYTSFFSAGLLYPCTISPGHQPPPC